jgi:phosphatidylinositol-3-phosphatase
MGGRLNRVLMAALFAGGGALACASCATSGDGGGDSGSALPDVTSPGDEPTGSTDASDASDASERAAVDADATVNVLDPDASDFGTPPQQEGTSGAGGDGGDGSTESADAPSDATSAGDSSGSDGAPAAEGGAADGGAGDGGADAGGLGDAASDAGPDAGPCGACPTGFACGAGQYCQTATGVPAFGRVFVIVLDDQPLSAIKGSTSAPYLNNLMSTYAYGTNYTTDDHPSLPNYLELTSGNPQATSCDCQPGSANTCTTLTCSTLLGSCTCHAAVSHLGDELDVAGIAWREYAESMGAPCNPLGADGGTLFAAAHVPFLYYDDVFTNSGRCQQRVRDFGDFAGDLASASGTPIRFSLVSPNVCNDMHSNCTGDAVKQGDTWLADHVPAILATPGFAAGGRDALFIVGDELPAALGSGPMPFVVASPLAKAGATTAGTYNHYSLLATIEDGLGLPRLGNSEGSATIADVWR